jgi:hypothetical protein
MWRWSQVYYHYVFFINNSNFYEHHVLDVDLFLIKRTKMNHSVGVMFLWWWDFNQCPFVMHDVLQLENPNNEYMNLMNLKWKLKFYHEKMESSTVPLSLLGILEQSSPWWGRLQSSVWILGLPRLLPFCSTVDSISSEMPELHHSNVFVIICSFSV